MVSTVDRPEIVFFDLETTIPTRIGQGFAILEFGSILVCPRKLVELDSYDTLVRPHDLSLISTLSVRANGITADAVVSAPAFSDIADRVYDILHGRVWAGHNILRFDCVRLREAYAQINKPPPEPKGTIDSLALLTQRFGRRAGDMKMATLAAYFGLGRQSHRSLDDVRLNLEVLKYCATVLFLESSLSDIFTDNNWASPNYTTSYHCNGKPTLEGTGSNTSPLSSSTNIENHTLPPNSTFSVVTPGEQIRNPIESGSARSDPFQMGQFIDEMESESLRSNEAMVEESSTTTQSDSVSNHTEFIEPEEVSIASISVAIVPFFHGYQKLQMVHKNIPMQIRYDGMMIRFGLSTRFVDHAGKARLSFVVYANSSNLCGVLDACDEIAKRFVDSDSNSEWRPVVSRKPGFYNSPTIRLDAGMIALTQKIMHGLLQIFTDNPCDLEYLFLPCGVNYTMDKDKSKRGKNSKNTSISGTNDNLNTRCNLRILLCDTNVENCREVFSLLCQCSYQVTQAFTAAEMKDALVLKGAYTDIILCEANLLLLNNGELLKAITENKMLQHIPVIMILTEDQVSLTMNGLGLGVADYLMRPASADELLNLWTHILARS